MALLSGFRYAQEMANICAVVPIAFVLLVMHSRLWLMSL
jgi:hypothetical protein